MGHAFAQPIRSLTSTLYGESPDSGETTCGNVDWAGAAAAVALWAMNIPNPRAAPVAAAAAMRVFVEFIALLLSVVCEFPCPLWTNTSLRRKRGSGNAP